MPQSRPHNHVVNHLALSVPDLEAAVSWYENMFGFQRIRPDSTSDRSEGDSAIFRIYGQKLQKVKIAYLSAGNGVGIEFFQFLDPPYKKPEQPFEFNRGGVFHFAVTVADAQETLRRVQESGGKLIGETVDVFGQTAFYVLDPWGNAVECLTVSFEKLLSNR